MAPVAPPTVAPNPVAALVAIPGAFLQLASNLIAAALTPLLAPAGPAAPAEPPVLWAVLAWVRREIQHTFFNGRPTLAYNPADNTQNDQGVVTGDLDPSDREGDPFTVTVTEGPQNGTVEVNPDGTFNYVPSAALAAAGGSDSFVVTVTDRGFHLHGLLGLFQPGGGHETTATVGVTVDPVNRAPGIGITDVVIDPTTGRVTGRLTWDDNGVTVLGLSSNTSTRGGEVTTDNGTFSYLPTDDIRHAAAVVGATTADQTDTFGIVVRDRWGRQFVESVTVPVTPHNTAPSVVSSVSTAGDGSIVITLSVTDDDDDPVRIVVSDPDAGDILGLPEDRTIIVAAGSTATLHYVPDSEAQPGTDTVTILVSDGYQGGQSTTAIPVTITSPNSAPVITEITTGTADSITGAISGTVGATDDGGEVAFSVGAASHGDVSIDATGQFTYTPDLNYFGTRAAGATDIFTVTVTDIDGTTATRTLTYTWTPTITGLAASDSIDDLSETDVWGWAVSPDGTTLYVNNGTPVFTPAGGIAQDIQVFQIAVDASGNRTYTQLDSIRVPGVIARNAIALSPDGTRLYVQLVDRPFVPYADQPAELRAIDIATGRLDPAFNIELDHKLFEMAIHPDGRRLYGVGPGLSDQIKVIDLTSGDSVLIGDGFPFRFIAVSPDGNTLYRNVNYDLVATDLNTYQSRVVSEVFYLDEPIAVSHDGTRLYLVDGVSERLMVLDASSGAVLQSIEVQAPVDQLSVTLDGTVYATTTAGGVQALSPVQQPTGTVTA